MPFTLSHPIATWPLWRLSGRRLDLPALFVGSTIPDIAYYVALQPVANIGHSLVGIGLEGIPSALLLLLIGRYWLWRPVVALLPGGIGDRIPSAVNYSFLPITRLLTIVFSIALGALTHIIWDSFTHNHRWGTDRLSILVVEVAGLPVYKWLQYGSSLIGLALLLIWLWKVLSQQPVYSTCKAVYKPAFSQRAISPQSLSQQWRGLTYAFVCVVASLTIYRTLSSAPVDASSSVIVVRAIIGTVSGVFAGLCLYAAIFWISRASPIKS